LLLSAVQAYSEPGEAERGYSATQVQITPTRHMPFEMRVVRVEFEHLWMQQVHESCARIKHVDLVPSRAVIKFLATPTQELLTQGVALPYGGILRHCPGHSYYERTSETVHWASMSLPVEQLISAGTAVGGGDLKPSRDSSIVIPPADAMRKLRQVASTSAAGTSTSAQ
jgi:hypothetical protein